MNFKKILLIDKNRTNSHTFIDYNNPFTYWDQFNKKKKPNTKT